MMLMGILENAKAKIGSKLQAYRETRAKEKEEYNYHYSQAYEKARASDIKKSATEKAQRDAHARAHPLEAISERLKGVGNNLEERSGSSLGRKVAPLGDFGRSIGKQYNNPGSHLPSALRDFDKPAKRPAAK